MQNGYMGFPMSKSERKNENNYNYYPADKYYKFNEAYNEADRSRALINARLDRLICENDAMKNYGRNYIPPGVNPSMYSYQVTDPLYYPLENPIKGEPLVLPKIEMGIPVQKLTKKSKKCKNHCNNNDNCQNGNALSISDIVALINMNRMNNQCSMNCQNYCAQNKINNPHSNFSYPSNSKCCQNNRSCDIGQNSNGRYSQNECRCNNFNDRGNRDCSLPDPRYIRVDYEERYRTPLKGIQISQKSSASHRKNKGKNASDQSKSSSVVSKSSANSSNISHTRKIHSPSIKKSQSTKKKASIIQRMSLVNSNLNSPDVGRMSSLNINKQPNNIDRMSSTNIDKPGHEIEIQSSALEQKVSITSKKSSLKEQVDIPEIKVSSPKILHNWWKETRNFVNMYKFFSIGDKLAKTSLIRDEEINEMTKSIIDHINSISSWLITIEDSFINEFKAYSSLNINFTDKANKNSFKKCSDNIMTVLTKFLTNLLVKTSKPSDLPDKILEVLYKYIKENAYVPKKYFSTFEINRLDFNFYGGLKNISENQAAMILVYFIISRAMIQKILLLPKQSLPQYKNSNNIQPSCFILGSVLHYLVKNAFSNVLPMIKEFVPLVNYYRNYHLTKKQMEEQLESRDKDFIFEDADEISKNLIPESDLNQFWKDNAAWVDSFKQKILNWALSMVKIIYSKFRDSNQGGEIKKSNPIKKN